MNTAHALGILEASIAAAFAVLLLGVLAVMAWERWGR